MRDPNSETLKAKRAVLELPEIAALLDRFWDGEIRIEIEKVKGKLSTIIIQVREDDLADEVVK